MLTIDAVLRRAEQVAPQAEAFVCGDERLDFAMFGQRARRLAHGLCAMGAAPGDRVAVLMANCHRFFEAYVGVPSAGLVVVPLNGRLAEQELQVILRESGARYLITDRVDIGGLGSLVEHVLRIPEDYERVIDHAGDLREDHQPHEDDTAAIFFTGGTSGRSKGVMLTHRALVSNAMHMIVASELGPDDRWLVMAPNFHVSGTFAALATVWVAATHVVQPGFDPAAALDLVHDEAITATLGVPLMLTAMAEKQKQRPRDISTLRYMAHAGAPITLEAVGMLRDIFTSTELVHFYGATETGPIATVLRHEEQHLGTPTERSAGQAVPGVEVAIWGLEDDRPRGDGQVGHVVVRDGQVGQVVVRGPNILSGYWNLPDETEAALRGDGWYRTGDLGYQDGRGHLFLVDRAKDMIVTGGENVYSTEVEAALLADERITEAAVFGVPDPRWGEAVHAVVVARGDVSAEELLAGCRERIAGYKLPKAVEFREGPLPRTPAGKLLKQQIRAPYWEGMDRQIHG